MRGVYDVDAHSLPLSQVVTHGSLRIGFMEGFTVVGREEADLLLAEANKLDVDVLCWGGTHRFDAYEYGDKFFVNPGSATGAMSTRWQADIEDPIPSFCLMDVSVLVPPVMRPGLAAEFKTNSSSLIGPGHITHTLRLPAAERCKWSRERRCGEGHVHQKCDRQYIILIVSKSILCPFKSISQISSPITPYMLTG